MDCILVTGACGMIGSHLVEGLLNEGYRVIGIDINPAKIDHENYIHECINLDDAEALKDIFKKNQIDRVIHLAALAHTDGIKNLNYEKYHHINVECAKNIFVSAFKCKIPVLFISTVDVFGFTKGIVTADTVPNPVTPYGKTKFLAENGLKRLSDKSGIPYTIFRFSPVYTEDIKRDIQKRYYLKYPNIAYQIGRGTEYEILSITNAVEAMVAWCREKPVCETKIIKDSIRMRTCDYIKEEKKQGRARIVFCFPTWTVKCGYTVIKKLIGENKYTYLLNKAVYPLKSE